MLIKELTVLSGLYERLSMYLKKVLVDGPRLYINQRVSSFLVHTWSMLHLKTLIVNNQELLLVLLVVYVRSRQSNSKAVPLYFSTFRGTNDALISEHKLL